MKKSVETPTLGDAGNAGHDFRRRLLRRMLEAMGDVQTANTDYLRWPDQRGPFGVVLRYMKETFVKVLRARRMVTRLNSSAREKASQQLDLIFEQEAGFEKLPGVLSDTESSDLVIDLLVYRMFGDRRVKLRRNNPAYWDAIRKLKSLTPQDSNVYSSFIGDLRLYDFNSIGYPIRMIAHPLNVLTTYLLEQYRLSRLPEPIGVQPGDVVIDGGACWGDTALYAGHLAGPSGRVHTFEFEPRNIELLNRNLALNPDIAPRITLHPHALWNRSDERLSFDQRGPASSVTASNSDDATITTLSIDDLVDRSGLDRVDFLKLDIEGAEYPALQGAERTLRRHRPRLAIAIYHSIEDLHRIARHIASLGLGYQLYVDHFTIHAEETILFGRCRSN